MGNIALRRANGGFVVSNSDSKLPPPNRRTKFHRDTGGFSSKIRRRKLHFWMTMDSDFGGEGKKNHHILGVPGREVASQEAVLGNHGSGGELFLRKESTLERKEIPAVKVKLVGAET